MRNESGIALVMVMGLLVVLSLIGVGLISQTVINTKFYESMGTSYQGVPTAQSDFVTKANVGTGNLVVGLGKRPSDGTLVTVLYGRNAGQVWQPNLNANPFYQYQTSNFSWVTTSGGTVTNSFIPTGRRGLDENAFLFKDDTGVLECWTSYTLHVEFNAGLSPDFGVYYNAGSVNNKDITGYLFRVSPMDDTFSISKVENGTPTPGGTQLVSFSATPFSGWTSGTSSGTGAPFDMWHSLDITVTGQPGETHVTTAKVDGVTVISFEPQSIKNPKLQPNLIGLSNWGGEGWGTSSNPSSVTFRNISVTNATP